MNNRSLRPELRRLPQFCTAVFSLLATVVTGLPALAQPEPSDSAPKANAESLLLEEPLTSEALFDAVVLMVDLAQPNLARRYLEQLIVQKPDDATVLKMRDKHGPAMFLKLSNDKSLQPLSIQLLEQMNAAFRNRANERVDEVIADLAGTPQTREVATVQLRNAGPVVVPRLLLSLSVQDAAKRDLLIDTLTRMGRQIVPPLLAALETPDPGLRSAVIFVLGEIADSSVAPHLWFYAFSAEQPDGVRTAARDALARIQYGTLKQRDEVTEFGAVAELQRLARQRFRHQIPWTTEDDGTISLWRWSPQERTVEAIKLTPEAAWLTTGQKFSQQALGLAEERLELQGLFLAFAFAVDAQRAGWEQPLPTGPGTAHDLALTTGAEVVSQALTEALASPSPAVAIACLQVLGQIGTRHQLYVKRSERSPITAALNYPDARVQFWAAATILQLDPESPFPGSSRVVEILRRALNDGGAARGLVVDANSQRASTVGGILRDLGYEPQTAPTGQDGFTAATERGDVELIVLDVNTVRWPLSLTVANLRADARTASIPIVIFGPEPRKDEVESLLRRYPLMAFVIETSSTDTFHSQLRPFLATMKAPPPTFEQRRQRIVSAVSWLAHIANGQRTKIFDLRLAEPELRGATSDPATAGDALFALAAIPTQSSQETLMEAAVKRGEDVEVRRTAVLQLAFHIQRFGLLLEEGRVAELNESWKGEPDPRVQTALASVVGSFRPNAKRVGERLRNFAGNAADQP